MVWYLVPDKDDSAAVWKRWLWDALVDLYEPTRQYGYKGQSAAASVLRRAELFQDRMDKFKENFGMATKKKREAWQTEWLHLDLTPEQKGSYRAWDLSEQDIIYTLGGFLSGGYKLTCNYNYQNSTYQASLICTEEGGVNSGMGVSGYAKEIWDAVAVLIFKVSVILPEKWTDYEAPGGDDIG